MKYCWGLFLSWLLAIPMSFAATLTAAQDPWPPFITGDPNMPGISVEVVTAAMKTQGYDVQFKVMPWARALDEVKNGRVDLLPATWYTKERTAFLRYSTPYIENELSFIKLVGNPFEYDGLASLQGKNVGIVRGYGYNSDFMTDKNFNRPESGDLVTNLKKLMSKRIDLTIEDKVVALSIMKEKGIPASQFAFTNKSLSRSPVHVTSGIANPNSQKYIDAYEKGIAAIQQNGTFDAILKKYGIK